VPRPIAGSPEKCRRGESDLTTNKQRSASRICLVTLSRRDKLKRAGEVVDRFASSNHNEHRREIVMATQSYRERMKAQRAEARAKRKAEKAEWQRQIELRCEVRRLAMDAVKAGIRARGDKLSLYSHAQLVAQANAMIGPWLVDHAKRQIAERNSQVMSKGERPAVQGLLLNETHAQNGAAK
jgi:hypothetical protein